MKTTTINSSSQSGSKLQRQIQNTNRQIMKNYEQKHSALTKIETILGIERETSNDFGSSAIISNNQRTTSLISLNEEEILYYSCKYFVIYNIGTKDYQIINKDIKNCTMVQMKKFNTTENDKKLIVCIYQTEHSRQTTYLGLLTVKTDYESRTSRSESRYEWKVIKFHTQPIALEDYCFYAKKNLLYFILTKPSLISSDSKPVFYNPLNLQSQKQSQKTQQYLWVYDLTKQLILLNHEIRSNTVGFFIQYISLEDPSLLYLVGKNYFRQWTINFNQKSIKESNVRNVERVLKNKIIVDFQEVQKYSFRQDSDHISEIPFLNPHLQHNNFHILTQPSKLLIILTCNELIFVKNNELISALNPDQIVSKQSRSKDNIEKELENSFNQIHKMKFLFEEYEELKEKEERKLMNATDGIRQHTEKDSFTNFTCISKSWKAQNQNYYFALANSSHHVLIYELVDYQLKLYTEFNCQVSSTLNSIVPTQGGDILLCLNQDNEVHLINQENYDPEDDLPIKSLWGNGQMHSGKVYAISSPMIQNIMCTVGEDGSFKLWSMKKNERSIIFEQKSPSRPLGITIHPGGTMIGVNFEREIKLFSILPKQFYEITSIKTNYCSLQLRYSERGEFLVSNEGSVLIFYEPFSLKTLGYIEPADLKSMIVDFKLSRNGGHVCFVTEDNSCYLQAIAIGEMSRWQHFTAAHKQSEPYTAFYFDVIQKQMVDEKREKQVVDEKKAINIFIGATRNKYMVLYANFGNKLLAEFPIVDCYIVDMEVHNNLLFAATSKGTLRVYSWPILEEDLELEIVNLEQNQIRYKPPKFEEYQVWHESIPITKLHRLNFSSELIITNSRGNMCIMSFQETKNKKILYEEVSSERKKMEQLINQMFYIKKSEAQKRNKLIEKTESDILKVENEIAREKVTLDRKMCEEEHMVGKGYEMKSLMQEQEKDQFLCKEYEQIELLKKQIQQKENNLEKIKSYILNDYESKKIYEQSRNEEVEEEIKAIILLHKDKIKRKIQTHKENIRNKKKDYFSKVKDIQAEFEEEIVKIYENKLKEMNDQQEEKVETAFGYEKLNSYSMNQGEENTVKTRSKSSQLIVRILNENALTTENALQTENEHLKSFINKLENIEMSGSPVANIPPIHYTFSTQNLSSTQIPTADHQHLTVSQKPLTASFSTNNHAALSASANPAKKLKRTGMYQLNERNFLKKKEKQEFINKQHEVSLKLHNELELVETEFHNELVQELNSKENEEIMIQAERVAELKQSNQLLERQIMNLKQKVEQMESEDESLQKEFQKNLEDYNLSRFQNLNLHCEVLKMQNQLIERKQVLQNKEEIVMLAYQEKQKLENYKELVKGELAKLQEKKQNMRETFFKKEIDLNSIFTELVNEIHKMEDKKATLQRLERKSKETTKEKHIKQSTLNEVVSKLKQIKKYLLLQRMNDEKSQKSIFQHEEQLLQTINFLKKRLYMESIKERKNKQLKKSAINQVLKQNKNLLQQCNQLRSEGIEYENEIRNLSNKLKQANKIISIETKLKSQKNEVSQQKNQLGIIKNLFNMHLRQFEDHDHDQATFNTPEQEHQKGESENQSEEGQQNETLLQNMVYFDSEKQKFSQSSRKQKLSQSNRTKPFFSSNANTFSTAKNKQSNKQNADHRLHKPFVLSKYIEAEPFQNIEI